MRGSNEAAVIYGEECLTSPAGNVPPTECNAPTCTIVCNPPYGQHIQDLFVCAANTGRPGADCNSKADTVPSPRHRLPPAGQRSEQRGAFCVTTRLIIDNPCDAKVAASSAGLPGRTRAAVSICCTPPLRPAGVWAGG